MMLLLVTSTLSISCKNSNNLNTTSNDNPNQITELEKETAKKEIRNVAIFILEHINKLDIETALKPYLNSPDFLLINPDGTYLDYAKFRVTNIDFFKQLVAFNQTTIKEEFRFITKTEVLYTWFGKSVMTLKTGERITNDSYIGTMIFKKINNEWRITFAQESTSPAKIEKVK